MAPDPTVTLYEGEMGGCLCQPWPFPTGTHFFYLPRRTCPRTCLQQRGAALEMPCVTWKSMEIQPAVPGDSTWIRHCTSSWVPGVSSVWQEGWSLLQLTEEYLHSLWGPNQNILILSKGSGKVSWRRELWISSFPLPKSNAELDVKAKTAPLFG